MLSLVHFQDVQESSSEIDDEGSDSSLDSSADAEYVPKTTNKRILKGRIVRRHKKLQYVRGRKLKRRSSRGIDVLPKGRIEDEKYYVPFKVYLLC